MAQDEAGNSTTRAVSVEVKPRRFKTDTIEIKDAFLERKLPELLPERGGSIPQGELLQGFLTVNRDRRKQAEETKRTLAAKTQPRPLWEGAFVQPRNTKVFSNFAETRTYRYHGQDVDTQIHYGYDLAAVQHGPVPAANSGIVVFAGPLSIYGNAVVVDHGLGLQTLYGHLSSIEVKEGDQVTKEQELGRSGSTGLALGDHLHYRGADQWRVGDAARMVGRPLDPRPHRPPASRSERAPARVDHAHRREGRRGPVGRPPAPGGPLPLVLSRAGGRRGVRVDGRERRPPASLRTRCVGRRSRPPRKRAARPAAS